MQGAAERRQVRPAGGEDALAVRVVGEGIQQVLEREVRVPPRDRLAERDSEHEFKSG